MELSDSIVSGLSQHQTAPTFYDDDYTLSASPDPIASSTIHQKLMKHFPGEVNEVSYNGEEGKMTRSSSSSSLGLLSSKTLKASIGPYSHAEEMSPEKPRSAKRSGSNCDVRAAASSNGNHKTFAGFDDDHDISIPDIQINQKEMDDLMADISGFSYLGGDESFVQQSIHTDSIKKSSERQKSFFDAQKRLKDQMVNDDIQCSKFSENGENPESGLPNEYLTASVYDDDNKSVSSCSSVESNRKEHESSKREDVMVLNGTKESRDSLSWNKTLKENFSDFSNEFAKVADDQKSEFLQHEEDANAEEHRFLQEEQIRPSTVSGYDTSTWSMGVTEDDFRIERPSWIAANASTISISTYGKSLSAPLGGLENNNVVRPFFGHPVVSPINKPVAVVEQSVRTDVDLTNASQENSIEDELPDDDQNTTATSLTSFIGTAPFKPANNIQASSTSNSSKNNSQLIVRSDRSIVAPDMFTSRGEKTFATFNLSGANNDSNVLSLTTIGKLIGDLSISANASRLAEVILKAKDDLAKRKSDRTLNASARNVSSTSVANNTSPRIVSTTCEANNSTTADASCSSNRKRRHEKSRSSSSSRKSIEKPVSVVSSNEKENICLNTESASSSVPTELAQQFVQTIFTNKRILAFGCVDLGENATLMVTIQNRSDEEIMRLKVEIKHDKDAFRLLNTNDDGCLLLHPSETFQLKVLFKPTQSKCYRDRVVLYSVSSAQRFCIPIIGYGGCARLVLANLSRLADGSNNRFDVTMKSFDDGDSSSVKLIVKNVGSSAAFFKTQIYSDVYCTRVATDRRINVNPSCGVIGEKFQLIVDVTYSGRVKKQCGNEGDTFLGCVGIQWGEEVSRRRLRAFEKAKKRPFFVKAQKFTDNFTGENDIACSFNEKDSSNCITVDDARLFVGHLREMQVNLFAPYDFSDDCSQSFFPLRLDRTVVGDCFSNGASQTSSKITSQFSPPVKDSPSRKADCSRNTVSVGLFKENAKMGPVAVIPSMVRFVDTGIGASDSVRVEFRNNSTTSNTIYLKIVSGPFFIKCPEYRLDARKLVRIPVHFEPKVSGKFVSVLNVYVSNGQSFNVELRGNTLNS